jgi:RecQ family ATP-dependent DNA helicase
MSRYASIEHKIEELIRKTGGVEEFEIIDALAGNGVSRPELKILLKYNLGKKWNKIDNRYFPVLEESEHQLYEKVTLLMQSGKKLEAFNILSSLRLHFPHKEQYLVESALLARELGLPEQKRLWADVMKQLQKVKNEQKNPEENGPKKSVTGSSGNSPILYVQLAIFRRKPFVIRTYDSENIKQKAYVLLPDMLPPDSLMQQINIDAETVLKGLPESQAIYGFLHDATGYNIVLSTRYEKEILVERFLEHSLRFEGYIVSLEELASLMGKTIKKPETIQSLASVFVQLLNEKASASRHKWLDEYAHLFAEAALNIKNKVIDFKVEEKQLPQKKILRPPASVEGILGIDGQLRKINQGFCYRDGQLTLAKEIFNCMSDGKTLMAEAPTGIGKSLAYLSAALLKIQKGEKIVVSTHTKNLQHQLFERDIPNFFDQFDITVSVVQVQGIGNYICLAKLEEKKDSVSGRFLKKWLKKYGRPFISDIPATILEGTSPHELKVQSDECLGEQCSFYKECYYFNSFKDLSEADIIVANHATLKKVLNMIDEKVHLVVDEAHHLYDSVLSMYSQELNLTRLLSLSSGVYSTTKSEGLKKLITVCSAAIDTALKEWDQDQNPDSRNEVFVSMTADKVLAHLKTLNSNIDIIEEQIQENEFLYSLLLILKSFIQSKQYKFFCFKTESGEVLLQGVQHDFVDRFKFLLERKTNSVTMLSACLLPKGWENRFATLLGMQNAKLVKIPSPFNLRKNSLLLMPSDIYAVPDRNESIEERCRMIERVSKILDGRTLVLFNSKMRMEHYASILKPLLEESGLTLLVPEEGRYSEAADVFREAGSGHVLLGLRSFWEGVDFPGSTLQCVVIESLPFRHHTDPSMVMAAKQMDASDIFEGAILPDAAMTLLQGCGRLLRTENDRGIIIVLDKRFQYKQYGEKLINSLPEYPMIRTTTDELILKIGQFFNKPGFNEERENEIDKWTIEDNILSIDKYYDIRTKILEFAKEKFYVRRLKEWQEDIIESLFIGKDIICIKETGAGKSLCFQIPALMRNALSIVVTPIVSLMRDQVMRLRELGFKEVGYIAGTQEEADREDTWHRLKNGEIRLLYVSPERLFRERFQDILKSNTLGSLIVDEAHCVSQWGHNFRLDFQNIGALYKENPFTGCAAFTATAPERVQKEIAESLLLREPKVINKLEPRKNLSLRVLDFSNIDRKEELFGEKIAWIMEILEEISGTVVVYTATQHDTERVCRVLQGLGVTAAMYHGGLEGDFKDLVHDRFHENDFKVIVATNAFGMGIDKPDIRGVIHFDIPGSPEAFYQEAGRAGRDGLDSQCIILYHPESEKVQHSFISELTYTRAEVEKTIDDLKEKGFAVFSYQTNYFEHEQRTKLVLHHLTRSGAVKQYYDLPLKFVVSNMEELLMRYPNYCENVTKNIIEVTRLRSSFSDVSQMKSVLKEWHKQGLIEIQDWGVWYEPNSNVTRDQFINLFPFQQLEEVKKNALYSLQKMREFIKNKDVCRMAYLHTYLNSPVSKDCGVCDICTRTFFPILERKRTKYFNSKQIEKEVLSIIKRHSGVSSLSYILNTLLGDVIRKGNMDRNDERFGSLALYSYSEIKDVAHRLINDGSVIRETEYPWRVRITAKGEKKLFELDS